MANHDPLLEDSNNATETTRLLPYTSSSESLQTRAGDDLPLQDETARLAALQLIPWYRRPSIYWLILFIALIALVMGMSAATTEQAVVQIVCREHYERQDQVDHSFTSSSSSYQEAANQSLLINITDGSIPKEDRCKEPENQPPEIQALAAILFSKLRALKNVTALLTVGYWTSLLDRHGRKSLIWATLLPALFSVLVVLYSASPYNKYGTKLLFVEALAQGLTGGSTLLDPALQSYAADTTRREGRSLIIGYMMVILAMGSIVGPNIAAYVIQRAGGRYTASIEVVALLLALCIPYVWIIPESLPASAKLRAQREDEAAAQEADKATQGSHRALKKLAYYLRNIFTPILIFVPGQIETIGDVVPMPHPYTLVLLVLISQLQQFVLFGIMDILIPYLNVRYHWGPTKAGFYFSFIGMSSFLVFLVLYPLTQWCYKKIFFKKEEGVDTATTSTTTETDSSPLEHDRSDGDQKEKLEMTRQTTWLEVHLFGVASCLFFLSSIIVPLREKESTMFASAFLRAAGQIGVTNYSSLLTMYAPAHQVGKVLGGSCVVDTINIAASALTFGWIFARTSATRPSFVYWIASLSGALSIVVFLVLWSLYKRHDRYVARLTRGAKPTAITLQ